MNTEKSINVLNGLIEINNDRIGEYETASKETQGGELKTMFSQLMRTSIKCNAELLNEVGKLGGIPPATSKTKSKFYRVWMDVKVTLTGNGCNTILNSCEHVDENAIDNYEKVLKNSIEHLTVRLQIILSTQHKLLKADYNKIKSFGDMFMDSEKMCFE